MKKYYTLSEAANILGKSKETLRRWDKQGKLPAFREPMSKYRIYPKSSVDLFSNLNTTSDSAISTTKPIPENNYTAVELFAGAGGLALGLEQAGLKCLALNEVDHWAAETLRINRPKWNVIGEDIRNVSFDKYKNRVDVVTGGFPCQAFSYAGKKLGLEDARGTLFYEFARVVAETRPLICVGENVRGLLTHDGGKTIEGMKNILEDIGYEPLPPQVLKAIFYKVPQKRERLFLIGIRKDIHVDFKYPEPHNKIYTLRDALKAGELFPTDAPPSEGATYPKRKREIFDKVPPGGYWRDLPEDLQREYMMKSYYLGGGKTGMARRISWDEPSLTLLCSPAQKQTDRCHPDETRPFTVREYARIQTFPDRWQFAGSVANQYKQIGNAVPVNLAREVGYALVSFLNLAYQKYDNLKSGYGKQTSLSF